MNRLIGLLMVCWAGAAVAAESPYGAVAPTIEVVAFGVRENAAVNGTTPGDQSPFFTATDAVGLPEDLAIQVSEIFAEEIDFHRDLTRGYVCTLVYEMYFPDGLPKPGRLLAARFEIQDQQLEAFLFATGDGAPTYFDARGLDIHRTLRLVDRDKEPWLATLSGQAMIKAFRRSPLEFSRITSKPAVLRYHPILKEWRAHRGTDYGAPVGTRVRATADGTVTFLGQRNSYGKLVELRHFERYTTRYGHLSAYAPGLAVGDTVAKGQVIGQVGMTGLATGPHLHYELHAEPGADRPDQLLLAIRSIPPHLRPAFEAEVEDYRRKLAFARRTNLVRLE